LKDFHHTVNHRAIEQRAVGRQSYHDICVERLSRSYKAIQYIALAAAKAPYAQACRQRD